MTARPSRLSGRESQPNLENFGPSCQVEESDESCLKREGWWKCEQEAPEVIGVQAEASIAGYVMGAL